MHLACNIVLKYLKQKRTELQGEMNTSTIRVGDFHLAFAETQVLRSKRVE